MWIRFNWCLSRLLIRGANRMAWNGFGLYLDRSRCSWTFWKISSQRPRQPLLSSNHAAKWCWKSWHDMLNYFRRFSWGSCRFVDLELARKQHAENRSQRHLRWVTRAWRIQLLGEDPRESWNWKLNSNFFWVCRSWKPFLQTWSVRKSAAKIFTAQVVKIAEKERLTQKDVNVEFR